MSAAGAITSATGAAGAGGSLLAGATPFGWASLAAGVLGGLAKGTPAGPSESGGFFGSTQSPFDNSGWTVNFGDNANQDARTGDRGGSMLTPTASGAGPGGYANSAGPGGSASGFPINPLYLAGGAVLLLLLWRKR